MNEVGFVNSSMPPAEKISLCLGSALTLAALGGILLYFENMIHMKLAAEMILGGAQFMVALAVFYHFKTIDEDKRNNARFVFLALLVTVAALNGALYSQFALNASKWQVLAFAGAFVISGLTTVLLASKAKAERNIQRHKDALAKTEEIFKSENDQQIRQRVDEICKKISPLRVLNYALKSDNPLMVIAFYDKFPEFGRGLIDEAIENRREKVAIALALKGVKPTESVLAEGLVAKIIPYQGKMALLFAKDRGLAAEILQHYSQARRQDLFQSIFNDPCFVDIFRHDISEESISLIVSEYRAMKLKNVHWEDCVKMAVLTNPQMAVFLIKELKTMSRNLVIDLVNLYRNTYPHNFKWDICIKFAIFSNNPELAIAFLKKIRTLENKQAIFESLQVIDDCTKTALNQGYNEFLCLLLEEDQNGSFIAALISTIFELNQSNPAKQLSIVNILGSPHVK